jgi:hypothetical protein
MGAATAALARRRDWPYLDDKARGRRQRRAGAVVQMVA